MSGSTARDGGRLRRDIGAQAAATGLSALAEFSTTVALARTLGPDRWGNVAFTMATTAVVFAAVDQRWQDAVVRFHAMRSAEGDGEALRRNLRQVVRGDAVTGIAAGAAAAVALWMIATARGADADAFAVIAPCVAVVTLKNAGNASARAYLRVSDRFARLARVTAMGAVMRCAAAAVVWFVTPASAPVAVCIALIGVACSAGALLGTAFAAARRDGLVRSVPAGTNDAAERAMVRRFLSVSWLSGIGLMPLREFDTMTVGLVAGPAAAGPYQAAKTVWNAMDMTLGPVQLALQPRMAALAHRDVDGSLAHLVHRTAGWGLAYGCVALAALEILAPSVLPAVFGPGFATAVPAVRAMALAFPVSAAFLWTIPLCAGAGRPDVNARASLAVMPIGIALIVGGAFLGEVGAALGFAATMALLLVVTAAFAARTPELGTVLRRSSPIARA